MVIAARAQGTGWIDHRRRAVACLADNNFCSIVTHLQERQEEAGPDKEKIQSMVKLTSPKFVLHMVIYQDLLADLAELSLDFQSD